MNPLPLQIKLIFLAVALFVAFCFGWSVNGWRLTSKIEKERAEAMQALIEQKEGYDELSRRLVKRYLEKQGETRVVYRTIKEKVDDATTGAICLGADAVSLWNDSLTGDLPDASAGAAAAAPGASEAGATDAEVLDNAIDNNEQYKACRNQLNALIDWHEIVAACQKASGDLQACIDRELNSRKEK